ncbi:MAG: AI-2E family transporter [Halobacteriaceae archaeon]
MASRLDIDRGRAAWWVLAAVLAVAVGYVVYTFVGTFVFGVFIYYATRPVYRRIERRTSHRSIAAALSLFVLALPAILVIAYTVAVGLQEFNKVAARFDLGFLETVLRPYIDIAAVVQDPQQLLDSPNALEIVRTFVENALGYLGFIGSALLHLFVMFTIAYYLLKDDRRLAGWFRRRFSDGDGVVSAYGRAVDRDFNNIFFGNILNAALTGTIGAVTYSLLDFGAPGGVGIPYPALVGLLAGVASLVPVVGMKLVYVPVAAYITAEASVVDPRLLWFPVAFVAVSFVVVDVIPDLVLRPYVSGRGLHLGSVMLAYIFGPLIWGWYGIFLGPMLLVCVVHFARIVLPELLAGRPIEPEAIGEEIDTTAPPTPPDDDAGGSPESDPDDGDAPASG